MSQLSSLAHTVLTDANLLNHITSFQCGIPAPVFKIWASHFGDTFRYRCANSTFLWTKISQEGDKDVQRLIMRLPWTKEQLMGIYPHPTVIAVECGRPQVLRWLLERGVRPRLYDSIWPIALRQFNGDFTILNILKTYLFNQMDDLGSSMYRKDIESVIADMKVLEWLSTNCSGFLLPPNSVIKAIGLGYLEQARFILEHDIARFDPRTYQIVWKQSLFDVLLYLSETRKEPWTQEFPALVAGAGQLDLLKLLHETRGLKGLDADAMDKAAANGHIGVVQFLHEHTDAKCSSKAMDIAAAGGHLEVVEFLHENRIEGCTPRAMDEAARHGRYQVLLFLHNQRSEGCTTSAVDAAAECGHLDIVEFPHENRTEGCTTDAMDQAAANGHLAVVQFSHEHRSEGCTTRTMGDAALLGHLDVVQYLYENRYEGCEEDDLVHLLMVGAVDVWLTMREKFPENDGVEGAMLYYAGDQMNLATIRFLCVSMGRYDFLPHAFEYLTHEHVGWIHTLAPLIRTCDRKLDMVESAIRVTETDSETKYPHIEYLVALCGDASREHAVSYAEQEARMIWRGIWNDVAQIQMCHRYFDCQIFPTGSFLSFMTKCRLQNSRASYRVVFLGVCELLGLCVPYL